MLSQTVVRCPVAGKVVPSVSTTQVKSHGMRARLKIIFTMAQAAQILPVNVRSDIYQEIASVVQDPQTWVRTPNDQLGGMEPRDFIGTDREPILRNLLELAKHGMTT